MNVSVLVRLRSVVCLGVVVALIILVFADGLEDVRGLTFGVADDDVDVLLLVVAVGERVVYLGRNGVLRIRIIIGTVDVITPGPVLLGDSIDDTKLDDFTRIGVHIGFTVVVLVNCDCSRQTSDLDQRIPVLGLLAVRAVGYEHGRDIGPGAFLKRGGIPVRSIGDDGPVNLEFGALAGIQANLLDRKSVV